MKAGQPNVPQGSFEKWGSCQTPEKVLGAVNPAGGGTLLPGMKEPYVSW
jgi:hypothetical protein